MNYISLKVHLSGVSGGLLRYHSSFLLFAVNLSMKIVFKMFLVRMIRNTTMLTQQVPRIKALYMYKQNMKSPLIIKKSAI